MIIMHYASTINWGKFDYEQYAEEHQTNNVDFTDNDDYGYEEHESYAKVN